MTAFVSLVFGYFFYWTIHEDFPPANATGPGVFWPSLAAGLLLGAWALTLLARRWNRRDKAGAFYPALLAACAARPDRRRARSRRAWLTGLDPATHVYPAIVWMLGDWAALHAAVGVIMQLYCVARRIAGRMTARHDIDIANVALYWHFVAITVVITVAVIAGFPLVK